MPDLFFLDNIKPTNKITGYHNLLLYNPRIVQYKDDEDHFENLLKTQN